MASSAGRCALLCVALPLATCVLFAATPTQVNTDQTDFFIDFDPSVPLSSDVDVVAIHDDFYGVPWQAFMRGSPTLNSLPLSWLARLNSTLAMVHAWDKPVYLALQMLSSGTGRTCPAQNASDGGPTGATVENFAGCTSCYNWNATTNPQAQAVIRAYALYAAFYFKAILQRAPKGVVAVNFAAEINLGARRCDSSWWGGVVEASNAVYSVLKQQALLLGSPSTLIFPSIQYEVVMGLETGPDQPCVGMTGGPSPSPELEACIADGLALVAPLSRDAFGVSTYPDNTKAGYPSQKPGWQPWYFPAVLGQLSEKDAATFLIAETGALADDLVVNLADGAVGAGLDPPPQCMSVLNTSVTDADAWLSYVIASAETGGWPLVTWWSDTDLLADEAVSSCPCTSPAGYENSCTFITAYREIYAAAGGVAWGGEVAAKAFATMGLRSIQGDVKPLWGTLQAARARRDDDEAQRARGVAR